jgi:hypothetical protein
MSIISISIIIIIIEAAQLWEEGKEGEKKKGFL